MKDFNSFINSTQSEKGKLYIEGGEVQEDEAWALTIDITKQWQDYDSKTITVVDFNNEYATLLMEQQQNISATVGDACWNEIEPVIADELRKATNPEESETVYDKLYDIFDKFDVHIETGENNENTDEIS